MSSNLPGLPVAEPIDLGDVLDVSFLDSDPSDNSSPSNLLTELESKKHLKTLSRWDVISVGAFRQTLETAGGGCDTSSARWSSEAGPSSSSFSYGHGMKQNSFGTLLFNDKAPPSSPESASASINADGSGGGSGSGVLSSPILLPVTPSHLSKNQQQQQQQQQQQNSPQKKRKEPRREKKKQTFKSPAAPAPHKYQQQHPHRHHHQHHPNTKMRGSSSLQRTHFFSSPASSVPSLNP